MTRPAEEATSRELARALELLEEIRAQTAGAPPTVAEFIDALVRGEAAALPSDARVEAGLAAGYVRGFACAKGVSVGDVSRAAAASDEFAR